MSQQQKSSHKARTVEKSEQNLHTSTSKFSWHIWKTKSFHTEAVVSVLVYYKTFFWNSSDFHNYAGYYIVWNFFFLDRSVWIPYFDSLFLLLKSEQRWHFSRLQSSQGDMPTIILPEKKKVKIWQKWKVSFSKQRQINSNCVLEAAF